MAIEKTKTINLDKNKIAAADKKQPVVMGSLFGKENYMLMLGGLVIMAIGFFLMAGGKSTDPKVFNDDDVYSATRITVAPFLIITGFVIEVFAIMKKPKQVQ